MSIPTMMKHTTIREPGDPDVLIPDQGPVPAVGAGEVLIRVEAAGVNRPDVMQREGNYNPPPGASLIPGLEVAGEIVAMDDSVTGFSIGDKVCALVSGGGYAEYCNAPAPQVLPVPDGLTMIEAAGVPENYFTVWTNVFERGGLKQGETILIHGGSSGIGTTAIQLAHLFGATVITTAGSDEKCQACLNLGADHAINYRDQDFAEQVKKITAGDGVNLILDMVGGDYIQKNISCLALEGRLVQIAFLQPPVNEINMMPVMINRLTITGSTLRPRTIKQKGAIADQLRQQVWPLFTAGKLKILVHETFALEDANEAHRMMESSVHIGKLILDTAK
ncbi:MAG: Phthiocerol/phenolphthiocerol synthesis polyketide synthase type I PpsC [SAR116 cluster bacterium MED-G04]|jgi:NADPH2:quinone reductase|nr:MAG: NAD(P)H-quinone oxidoreductase [Gammaproteobacteria bacterium TMED183]CAI8384390.1 MAG: Phthiocerol/phenolphthiocerol synthesis polyketide synthase type I PpsC [SAR116 cluster bacterium MED-G04]